MISPSSGVGTSSKRGLRPRRRSSRKPARSDESSRVPMFDQRSMSRADKSAGFSESSLTLDTSSEPRAVLDALTHTSVSTTPALERYRFLIGTRRSPIRRHPDGPRLIHTIQGMSGCSTPIALARTIRHLLQEHARERLRLRGQLRAWDRPDNGSRGRQLALTNSDSTRVVSVLYFGIKR
jgi:hypothetical protein